MPKNSKFPEGVKWEILEFQISEHQNFKITFRKIEIEVLQKIKDLYFADKKHKCFISIMFQTVISTLFECY